MVKDSIDIRPPFAKSRREYVSRNSSIYTQRRVFDRRGLLEKEIWELDNGKAVVVFDDGAYISKRKAEALRMNSVEPSALMNLAKREDYFENNGIICFLYRGEFYYSSEIVEVNPPFEEDYRDAYDITKDLEGL